MIADLSSLQKEIQLLKGERASSELSEDENQTLEKISDLYNSLMDTKNDSETDIEAVRNEITLHFY